MANTAAPNLEIEHPVLDVIRSRWSPAIYSPQTVEPEKLLSVLEAARWAPSSYNAQPWSFLVARKEQPEEFARMLSCLVPGNVTWAQHVPVLMISVAKLQFDNGNANRHALHDTGIATGFLMLQAASLGILAHGMAGFDPAKARELYAIPLTHEAVAAIGLGYPGDEQGALEELRKRNARHKPRRTLDQFVFAGRWGQSWRTL
jgi:nitroreductase